MQVIKKFLYTFIFFACLLLAGKAVAQSDGSTTTSGQEQQVSYDNQGRPIRAQKGDDSLRHRDPNADSITVAYRYFDSVRYHTIDSAINDNNRYLPAPFTYVDLGNPGTPAHSLLFKPFMQAGWDAGFHAMDIYRFDLAGTRYFTTTKPLTTLGYTTGSKTEQWIDVLHTQNRKSTVNIALEFRLVNDPGSFKSQNTNNSNIRFNISSQSRDLRYSYNLIYIANSLNASANGGITSDSSLTKNSLNGQFSIPTRLASSSSNNSNPFNTTIRTGNKFADKTFYFRHSYDLGQKDSIVMDSTTKHLFYPRVRFQHSLQYTTYDYQFIDAEPVSLDYLTYYNYLVASDTIHFQDRWKELTNELSIYTFPDKKNQGQYLKLDGGWQMLSGKLGSGLTQKYNNIYVGAEYRNRTRNQKWDMEAVGKLYVTGTYVGDYAAYVSLQRMVTGLGALKVGMQNVNRTPSYIFNSSGSGNLSFSDQSISTAAHSDFPVVSDGSWKKENITRGFAQLDIPYLRLKLTGNYYFYTNYTYFDDFFSAKQYNSVFNVLQLGAEKETALGKYFKWYSELYVQKKAGGAPVNLPLVLLRNRIALEGNFFHNLFIATGIEVRYYSPYKADNYSPFTGQFFYQDNYTVSNRPDVSYYLNFRIKRFRFFGQLSNLNTINYSKTQGFGFYKYNFTAPNYPSPGMWLRLGVKCMLIN